MADRHDLLSEKEFLDVKRRSEQMGGSTISNIEFAGKTLVFKTVGLTGLYEQRIKILDLDYRKLRVTTYSQMRELILNSQFKVYCNCPAFKYWGFKYIADVLDYGLRQEGRFPEVRNPQERGYVCKHLYSAIFAMQFIVNGIAKQFENYINLGD